MAGPWQQQWSSHAPSHSTWSYDSQPGSGVVSCSSSWPQEAYEGSPAGKKDKDKYRSITTLGQGGRHCLTLDDRKALLMDLLALLATRSNIPVLSKLAISAFNATTTHALLFWLTRVTPRTCVRYLRDDEQVFTIAHAAHSLAESAVSTHGNEKVFC